MPHARARILRLCIFAAALLALPVAHARAAATDPVTLAWHAPQRGHSLSASESISRLVHLNANAFVLKIAAGKGYPMTILEDRSQTVGVDARGTCLNVKEDNTRHYGGDHPQDTSTKKRSAITTVALDSSGRYCLLPPLFALDVATPSPTGTPAASSLACASPSAPPATEDAQRFSDPGDAALAEFPSQRVAPGATWTFARPIRVDRELGSGTMNYTDRLERIEDRAGHRIAIIAVNGLGRVDAVKDLQAKGFKTAPMVFAGTAEFDLSEGVPLAQHYTAHVEWGTRILGAHVGLVVDETYSAKPWSVTPPS
ncbi:MAG: hypothetical protein M3007_08675 [Candidatus Eremiobacteraeota bacterium]|nr:hypothetical protein [Candidatus Eremiobacteraeota bacterium]